MTHNVQAFASVGAFVTVSAGCRCSLKERIFIFTTKPSQRHYERMQTAAGGLVNGLPMTKDW